MSWAEDKARKLEAMRAAGGFADDYTLIEWAIPEAIRKLGEP